MVLGGGQGQRRGALTHGDEAGLLALQKLFDHHASTAGIVLHAQAVVEQHEIHGLVRLGQGHRDHHTLAGGKTIGLHHNGSPHAVDVGVGQGCIGEGVVLGSWNAMTLHERLGKCLGAFELCGRARRAKNAQALGSEHIDHARCQR